ncbi:MAG: UDP-N-acetylglucosamine 2-epimerase (non-hydrolyzing) [Flavobacteriales bacterium]|nr:UDP-N-acetylglucosamine 2-epimerase (non-hydrolyzing) [Flavobacteriales bacterium]
MKILILVGTRPNFIKVTQFRKAALHHPGVDIKIVHTGQHSDEKMADIFFRQFELSPDFFLNISMAAPAVQMGEIMIRLAALMENEFRPDILIVPGDVNSTLAGALVANKMNIRLAHLESGLRSFDRTMPEEINRLMTDEISDLYFVTEPSGIEHLTNENRNGQIHFVGNTMIDTLVAFQSQIDQSTVLQDINVEKSKYVLMTIHRPSNVDSKEGLEKLLALITNLSNRYKIVFPIHPRTIQRIAQFGLKDSFDAIEQLIVSEPIGYFEFQRLIRDSKFILTDSGGIQEESTYCRVPCLTLRENTERPVTIIQGTNTLIPFDLQILDKYISEIENGSYKSGAIPEKWDGKATERIMRILTS